MLYIMWEVGFKGTMPKRPVHKQHLAHSTTHGQQYIYIKYGWTD